MTRIEVFSDAAFAFAVTMLVISLSAIPHTYEELVLAIKAIPAFALSFCVIMALWSSHRRWSRRFGLDDKISTFLTLALIFVILVYVYPLKIIMNILFFAISGGWFPSQFVITSASEVAGLMAFYGVGFFLVGIIHLGLYQQAAAKATLLSLSPLEIILVKEEQLIWLLNASIALASTLFALVFMQSWGYLAGFFYSLLPIIVPLSTLHFKKKKRALQAEATVENDTDV